MYACPIFAFAVDDILAAREEMERKGVEFATEISTWEDEVWFYFHGPDGCLYEIKQTGFKPESGHGS